MSFLTSTVPSTSVPVPAPGGSCPLLLISTFHHPAYRRRTDPSFRDPTRIGLDAKVVVPEDEPDQEVEREQQPDRLCREDAPAKDGQDDKELRGVGDEDDQAGRAADPARRKTRSTSARRRSSGEEGSEHAPQTAGQSRHLRAGIALSIVLRSLPSCRSLTLNPTSASLNSSNRLELSSKRTRPRLSHPWQLQVAAKLQVNPQPTTTSSTIPMQAGRRTLLQGLLQLGFRRLRSVVVLAIPGHVHHERHLIHLRQRPLPLPPPLAFVARFRGRPDFEAHVVPAARRGEEAAFGEEPDGVRCKGVA